MHDLIKFNKINRLKSVYRMNSVEGRKESSAEHSWSCLVLADHFLINYPQLNRLKIYELLIYHDLHELEIGDNPLDPKKDKLDNTKAEFEAANKLSRKLPSVLAAKYLGAATEFSEQKSKEARFARAIDVFDSMIQEIDFKSDWKGWTKEFLIRKKASYFEEFPTIKQAFFELLDLMEEQGYFSQ